MYKYNQSSLVILPFTGDLPITIESHILLSEIIDTVLLALEGSGIGIPKVISSTWCVLFMSQSFSSSHTVINLYIYSGHSRKVILKASYFISDSFDDFFSNFVKFNDGISGVWGVSSNSTFSMTNFGYGDKNFLNVISSPNLIETLLIECGRGKVSFFSILLLPLN